MKKLAIILPVVLALGCREDPKDTGGDPAIDADQDGYYADVDEGSAEYDCDDENAEVHPGALEYCDGIDNDCDGLVDEADAEDTTTWYRDLDGDGYGADETAIVACDRPSDSYVTTKGDCNDYSTEYNPGAHEADCEDPNDYNCDGSVGYEDADEDGMAACEGDCDDSRADVNPEMDEICDDENPPVDENCDGYVNDSTAVDAPTWYADSDSDGYGTPTYEEVTCDQPEGFVENDEDCDDNDPDINPDGSEVCDEQDNDCDGLVDDDDDSVDTSTMTTWYEDADGDGYGNEDDAGTDQCAQPSGYVDNAEDCYDENADVNPDGTESCNGIDDDCNGTVDDNATDAVTLYIDYDEDGYGSDQYTTTGCPDTDGYVENAEDCDDTDAEVNPEGVEVCDGVDNDCNGAVDDDPEDPAVWYEDDDADGYGNPDSTSVACDQPDGYVENDEDCDDTDASVNPAALEYCNGIDDNCDDEVDEDEAADAVTWYLDADGDNYGDDTAVDSTVACDQPDGYAESASDCDDDDPDISPDADEYCDSVDNDCDGMVDEASALDAPTWYEDADEDGYGTDATTTVACSEPADYVSDATDCDDADSEVNPGADEVCNDGIDNNCDGEAGQCEYELTTGITQFQGEAEYDEFGASFLPLGDYDGDGYEDALATAYKSDRGGGAEAGATYLFYGPFTEGSTISAADADIILQGEAASDFSGVSVGYGTDVSGDGYADLAVGANGEDTGGAKAGAVYVTMGPLTAGEWDLSNDDFYKLIGSASYDKAGRSAHFLDTWNETTDTASPASGTLLVGAIGASENGSKAGAIYVVHGPISSLADSDNEVQLGAVDDYLMGEAASEQMGSEVAVLPDENGDGYEDLLIGVQRNDETGTDAGVMYMVNGPVTGALDLVDADIRMLGEVGGDLFGSMVASPGDVDGDGYSDMLVAGQYVSTGVTDGGAVYLIPGQTTETTPTDAASVTITGATAYDSIGSDLAMDGDFDGDGNQDLLVGAATVGDNTEGCAYLFYGPLSGSYTTDEADATLGGDDFEDATGNGVFFFEDIDGAGSTALGVTEPGDNTVASDAGVVHLLFELGL